MDGTTGRMVVSNHRSMLDILVLLAAFGGHLLSRDDLARWPVIGRLAPYAGTLYVDRSSTASGSAAMLAMISRLREGRSLTVFPEGTTYPDDTVRDFHAGAFAAALVMPVPVTVPPPALPAPQGVLAALRTAAAGDNPNAQSLEDLARWIHLTGADDLTNTRAADLAEQAARAAPTVSRWLLLADVTNDRNRRLESLRRALALAPDDPHVLTAMGHARRVGVRPEEGLPFIDRALARDPGYALAHMERAFALDGIGLPFAAHRGLEEAAALAPRSAQLLRARIALAERASQSDLANTLRRALARLRGGDVDVWESLARDARTRGDSAEVRRLAERLVALRPDQLSVYNQAAELFESVGDADRAVAVLAQGTDLAPGEASLWASRAALEARLGRNDDARASLRQALALPLRPPPRRQHPRRPSRRRRPRRPRRRSW